MWNFLFFIGWLGIAALSLIGIFTGIVPSTTDFVNFFEIKTRLVMISISLFFFILFIRKFIEIFEKGEGRSVVVENDMGRIGISMNSIESLTAGVLKSTTFIKEFNIKSVLIKNEVKLTINIETNAKEAINQEIQKLQSVIIDYVEKVTGIKIAQVNIVVGQMCYEEEKKSRETKALQ